VASNEVERGERNPRKGETFIVATLKGKRAGKMPALRGSCDAVERGGDGFGVVAEGFEPVDVWLAAEPCELALGEAARGLLDICDCHGQADAAFEVGAEVGVADELERLGAGRNAAGIFRYPRRFTHPFMHPRGNEGADFVETAGGEHGFDARVDAGVEGGAWRREADFRDGVAFEGICIDPFTGSYTHLFPLLTTHFFTHFAMYFPADFFTRFTARVGAAGAENFGDGFSGEDAHFDRADYFGGVARGDASGGFGVEAGEDFVQVRCAMLFGAASQTLAQFFRARRGIGEAFEERAEIESCAGGDDWQLVAAAEIVEREERVAAVVAGGEDFVGLDEVDEVMRDLLLTSRGDLRGADVEVAIDLGRIADEDFAVEAAGEFDGERGFAGGGGAEDDDEARVRGGVHLSARASSGGAGRRERWPRGLARRGFACG